MSPLILYIDETPGLPAGVAEALEADGCRIQHTADPEEAMRWVEERQPVLVVMEIALEGCEGLHLLAGIRAVRDGSVPVLVVTRLPRDSAIHGEAIALGVVDFLTRPVPDRELLHAIQEVVMSGREEAPRQAASLPDSDLSGELSDTPMPEVLARLRRRGASGALAVGHAGVRVGVQLRNGSPVGVSSSRRELVAESLLFETFRWEEGRFAFSERQSIESESLLALEDDPAKLLLKGVLEASPPQRVRERLAKRESLYASFVGGSDSVLDAAGVRLTREQRELLEGLGGADTLSVVLDSPVFGDQLVYALWVAGWLELQTQPTLTLTELLGDATDPDAEPEPLPKPVLKPRPAREAPEPPDEHERELAAQRRTRERRGQELEALARKRREREDELDALARTREERARELEALARKREEREAELEALARTREERARELEALAGARKRRARELEELARAREERTRELHELAPALDEGAQELEALARKREQREQELEALARAREESERQLEELAPALEEHTREIEELRRAREERARQLEELARAREEHARELEELEPALEEHAREIEELRRAREERARELEELARARDESARELEELERMREERVQELAQLARRRAQRKRSLQELAAPPEDVEAPEPTEAEDRAQPAEAEDRTQPAEAEDREQPAEAEEQAEPMETSPAEAEPKHGEIALVAPESADGDTLSRTLRELARRVLARDDFAVLGIGASASDAEVRAAYESLVAQIPEIAPTPANLVYAQRAKRIRSRVEAAFANLRDEEKRRAYSLMRAEEEQDRKARPSAERALEGESWFRKGRAELERKNTAAALEAFGMASHLDPEQGEYASHLGYALYLSNPRDADVQREAMEHVARGIKRSPKSEHSYLFLGRILMAKGDTSVARKIFQKALRIKPDFHPAVRELRLLEMRERKAKGVLSKILKR